MKNILTIFKKEWDRVIKDKRLVITIMILPGLMIFLIYSFIGTAMQNLTTDDIYNVAIVNPQLDFKTIYEEYEDTTSLNVVIIEEAQMAEYQLLIDEGEWSLLIFLDEDIVAYDGSGDKPNVSIYSNPNEITSSNIRNNFSNYLVFYQESLGFELFGDTTYFDLEYLGTPLDQSILAGTLLASLLPMLIIMFLFSGAMSIGPESIAGEKERGTIATLLVTPVKRKEIAIGKIFALSVLTLISATSSFIGIMASLPKLMQFGEGVSTDIYAVGDYFMILVVLFSTVFVIVGIISIVSAYAKSLKEASAMIMPIYILTILVSVTSMFGDGANTNIIMYAIPIYNAVQSLTAILTFDTASLSYILVTILSNIAYLVLFVFILRKMFNSEKIMFSK
ncbi:ABC transporter permease subunit [Mycoplasmatota bacterium WC30]